MKIRTSAERGQADHGWLQSKHSFSFAEYFDAEHIEFGVLRVINEDRVAPKMGFGTHRHQDMEIISYVLSGALNHQDSMGNGSVMQPGDVQRMSAGSGITHSERNDSATMPVHFLQIWIQPNIKGSPPSYEQKHFTDDEKRGRLRLVISEGGEQGSLRMQQDARLYAGLFDGKEQTKLRISKGRMVYVHLICGTLSVNGTLISGGDALMIIETAAVEILGGDQAEVLLFDLPTNKTR